MAGPITREPLIIVELSATAPLRSRRLTSIGIEAWNAGAFNAWPMPIDQVAGEQRARDASLATNSAITAENTICTDCMAIRKPRRGSLSASTPPGIDSSSVGPSRANTISPTATPEWKRSSTYPPSRVVCIHVPTLDRKTPIQMMRKSR